MDALKRVGWDGLGERIAAAARAAVAMHVDEVVREGSEVGGVERGLRGTQAEGLLALVRERAVVGQGLGGVRK